MNSSFSPAPIPEFCTARLLLRGVEESDVPAYERNFVDYEVIRHLAGTVPWPYPAGGVLDYIRHTIHPRQGIDRWVWGIFLREEPGELIGVVDLWRNGNPENRGFFLGRRYWGHGYMTEACEPVTDYAFTSLGFLRLLFANAVGNRKSRRVKEKCGARLIRVEPASFVDPAYTEHEVWELTRDDWAARRA